MVVGLLVVAIAGPSGAATAGGQPAGPDRLELAGQTSWVSLGERFEVALAVPPLPGGAVRFVVHNDLLFRGAFERSLEGDLGSTIFESDPQPLDSLPRDSDGTLRAGFATGGAGTGADLDDYGVYPVEIELLDATGSTVDGLTTHLLLLPDPGNNFPPLAVAVVLDVAAPPALQPDGAAAIDNESLERIAERVDVLEAAPNVPVTIAALPETLDGLADVGGRGQTLLQNLNRALRSRLFLARPYADIDVEALAEADLLSEVNAHAASGADVIRTRFGTEPLGGTWLSGPTLGDRAARLLVELGVPRAVVPETALEEFADGSVEPVPDKPFALGDGGPEALVADADLAADLTGGDGIIEAYRFLARLAMQWYERPADQRAAVVVVPPDAPIDPAVVSRALQGLTEGGVRAVTIDQTFALVTPDDDADPTTPLAPHEPADDLTGLAPRIQSARSQVAGFGALIGDPAAASSLQRSLLLATGTATPDDERRAYVDRVTGEIGGLADAIDAPDEFRITLTSRSGTIPLTLTNNTPRPVEVRVELDSAALEFPEGDVLQLTLDPGANRQDIPVRVRTSGAFPLDITVTSPDAAIVLDTARFDIRSTAVSGVGLVLSIGAGLFLTIWWARHWHTSRRSRRLVPVARPPRGDDARHPDNHRPAHLAGRPRSVVGAEQRPGE